MLPLPPFEGPVPDLTTEPNLEYLFGELPSATDAAAADVRDNGAVLSSSYLCSGEIPILPSLVHHPSQDQHDSRNNDRNNDPFTTENFPTLAEQNPNTLLHASSEEQHSLQPNLGHSQVWRCGGMLNPDHHETSLVEPAFNPKTPENNSMSETERDNNGQANGRLTTFETHPPLGAAHTESSKGNFIPCSQLPTSDVLPQQPGFLLTRSSAGDGVIPSSNNQEYLPTQDALSTSLTTGSSLSPFFHVRPTDAESERPAKRQRRHKALTLADVTPLSSPHVSVSPTQADPFLNRGCIMSDNQSQLDSMTENDAVVAQLLTKYGIEYQRKTTSPDSASNQGATAGRIEDGFHHGERVTYDRLHQSARSPPDAVRITRKEDCTQPPTHHATSFNVGPEGERHPAEAFIETPQGFSKQSEATVVGFDTHSVTMRLENPPECNQCKKLYINDDILNKHIRTAHREQNSDVHKCNECNDNFKNSTNLQRHTHEAHVNRAFYCVEQSCRAGFSTERALVLHKKKRTLHA